MVIEYARNVFDYKEANSTEFDENTPYPVIDLMEEQKKMLNLGGTMRLGAQKIEIFPNTKLHKIYGEKNSVLERHRHRYEVNYKEFENMFEKGKNVPNKLSISAMTDFVEAIELNSHPFYIGIQYHPEFKTKVGDPHPIFKAFIEAIEQNK
jgi:CTP synthase